MKLRVGYADYAVMFMNPDTHPGFGTNLGQCLVEDHIILVDPTQPPAEMASTVLHEALHAIAAVYRLPDAFTEESMCLSLEGPLLSLIRDNPHLIAALVGATEGQKMKLPTMKDS